MDQAVLEESVVVEPGHGGLAGALREAWEYREVLRFLAWRDIQVRYKQTVLGLLWALLQPFTTMVVFCLVFNRMAGIQAEGAPYAVFVYVGLLPWLLFRDSLQRASDSIVSEARVLTKVYFSRLLVPIAAIGSALADFLVSLSMLFVLMLWYGCPLRMTALCLPLLTLYAMVAALAIGLWLSAANARFRDVRHTVPFLLQIGLFLSPVAYPTRKMAAVLPEGWRWVIDLNPLVGVIDGFRWALLSTEPAPIESLAVSLGAVTVILVGGLYYFLSVERTFADVL